MKSPPGVAEASGSLMDTNLSGRRPVSGFGRAAAYAGPVAADLPLPRLVLASASPARLATLRAAGVDPLVRVSGVDEEAVTGLSPAALALRLAELKSAAVAAHPDLPPGSLVLGCDSVLELAGRAWGKPGSAQEATSRWRAMRGSSGVLHTGHCLHDRDGDLRCSATASTRVHFADLTEEEIDSYVATGEPLAVAGAFTVDGLGGAFVTGIEGDHHNVVGVSLPLVRDLMARLGHRWIDLWAQPAPPDEQ